MFFKIIIKKPYSKLLQFLMNNLEIFNALFLFSNILGYIPLVINSIRKRKKKNQFNKYISMYLYFIALASLYELVFSYYLKINVEIWFKVYSLLEFILILQIFKTQKKGLNNFLYTFFTFLYISILTYVTLWIPEKHFLFHDALLNFVTFLFIISFSIVWFKNTIKSNESLLLNIPFFYFLSGLMIYYSGIIFLSIFSLAIINSNISINEFWITNIIFLIIHRIILILMALKK